MITFEELTIGEQEVLRELWASHHHYGEPLHYRNGHPRDAFLAQLIERRLAYETRYQSQPCCRPTVIGIIAYTNSQRYKEDCIANPHWGRTGT